MKLLISKKSIEHIIYGFILFLSLFMYFYPEQYVFLPFSTIRITQILGIFVFFLYYIRSVNHLSIQKLVVYGIIILLIGIFSSKIFNFTGDLEVAKRGILIIAYIFCSYLIAFCLKKTVESYSIYALLEWIVYITICQAVISFIFFIIPSTYELYKQFIILDDFNDTMTEMSSKFRLMSVGGLRYATAASQYGLVLWALILLHENKYGFWGRHTILYKLVVALFCLAGVLSGRVFFVMLPITIFYIISIKKFHIGESLKMILSTFLPVIIIALIAFVYLFAGNEELVSWAFELFINLDETGQLESASTNQLKDMYVFPDNLKTWLVGDGLSKGANGGFYMDTDVGYIRSIFYWGIFGTFIYYYIQYCCYKNIIQLGISYDVRIYILYILMWLFIYSFKDFYSVDKLLVLFTVVIAYNKTEKLPKF